MIPQVAIEKLERKLGLKFSEEEKKVIHQEARMTNVAKNTLILKMGERSYSIYFIIKGLVRGYYLDSNGEEVTKCFAYENGFCSTEGLRKEAVSSFYIDALEDCVFLAIPYELLIRFMGANRQINTSVQRLFAEEIERLEVRSRQMMMMDAKERYRAFEEDYAKVKHRIKKQMIASYIGIKPGSLSRIQKNIHNSTEN